MPGRATPFLNCTDLPRSLAFYKKLGFKVEHLTKRDRKPAFASLDLDGGKLFVGDAALGADQPGFKEWMATPLGAGIMLNWEVPDVDAVWKRAERLGAPVEFPIMDDAMGRMFAVLDPDGYVVGFWTAVKALPRKKAARKPAKKAAKRPARKAPARKR